MPSLFHRFLSIFFEFDNNVNAGIRVFMQTPGAISVETQWRQQFPTATDAEINALAARCKEIEDYVAARGEEVRDYKLSPPDAIRMIGKTFPELNTNVCKEVHGWGVSIACIRRFNAVAKMYVERRTTAFEACWRELFPQATNLGLDNSKEINQWFTFFKEIEDYACARGKEILNNKLTQSEASRMIGKKFPELHAELREICVSRGLEMASK